MSAFSILQKYSCSTDVYGIFNLAFCYESGSGTEVNYDKAKHYYALAVEKGLAAAYVNLGLLYLSCGDDYKKAFDLFKTASQNITTRKIATISMAVMYECGLGVEQSEQLAHEMYYLVRKELNNQPIESGKNEREISLERGKAEIFIKGFCHANAIGMPKDYNKAVEYWNKASGMGMEAAKNWIEQIKKQ